MVHVSLVWRLGRLVRVPFLIAVFTSISLSAFAGSSGFRSVSSTPYDRQMSRVQPVLTIRAAAYPGQFPSLAITSWMMELRAVPYQYSKVWRTPAELSVTQAGDCKSKAVALYAEMRQSGAQNLRVVIGKRHIFDAATHTWVEWDTPGGRYLLDPTFNEAPIRSAMMDPATYVPFYAYDGANKYRAISASLATTTRTAATVPASGTHLAVARSPAHPTTLHRASPTRARYSSVNTHRRHAAPTTLHTPVVATMPSQWSPQW
jgi:hypothetical protein